MNAKQLRDATLDELVREYRTAASGHGRGMAEADPKKANSHHAVLAAVYRELRQRGVEAQRALLPLLNDIDSGVRLWAAAHGLEFASEEAVPVLREIAEDRGRSSFDAGMTLKEWRKDELRFP